MMLLALPKDLSEEKSGTYSITVRVIWLWL